MAVGKAYQFDIWPLSSVEGKMNPTKAHLESGQSAVDVNSPKLLGLVVVDPHAVIGIKID